MIDYVLMQGKTTDALSKLISLQPTTAVLVHMDANKQEKRYMKSNMASSLHAMTVVQIMYVYTVNHEQKSKELLQKCP